MSRTSALILIALIFGAMSTSMAAKDVVVSGSTTVLPLGESAAEAFNAKQSDYHVSVSGGGTGAGITNIAEGRSSIAMASREVTADEKAKYGDEFKEFLVGYDGICVAVSKQIFDEGVKALTLDQVKKIYSGEITNWDQVGGPDKDIYVIAREDGSGTKDTFNEDVMGSKAAETKGVDEHGSVETGNAGVKTAITGSDKAIGYLGYSYATDGKVGLISINGVTPSPETIKDGSFKLARKLYMYTFGEPMEGSEAFLDFVLGTEGQAVAQKNGFIPV
jgi:phosphate transport system substrate-binding protein